MIVNETKQNNRQIKPPRSQPTGFSTPASGSRTTQVLLSAGWWVQCRSLAHPPSLGRCPRLLVTSREEPVGQETPSTYEGLAPRQLPSAVSQASSTGMASSAATWTDLTRQGGSTRGGTARHRLLPWVPVSREGFWSLSWKGRAQCTPAPPLAAASSPFLRPLFGKSAHRETPWHTPEPVHTDTLCPPKVPRKQSQEHFAQEPPWAPPSGP